MRISMEMLHDWLKRYEPEPDIRVNKRHLQNVRLFSENLRFSPTTVYLMPMEFDKVVCSNENDILVLHSDDINEVFNDILDAFEFYNTWESDVYREIEAGCSEKELLEKVADLTGFFLILADTGFYMRETAGPSELRNAHRGLTDMIEQRMLPYSVLEEISSQPYVRRHDVPPYLTGVPGLGTACVTNLFVGPDHAGWLIACGPTAEFSQMEKDRIDCAGRIIEYWLSRNQSIREHSQKAGILLDLLNGEEEKSGKTEDRLSTFGWMEQDDKQVYVLRQNGSAQLSPEALQRRLELHFPDAFVLQHEGELILLVNYALNGSEELRLSLEEILKDCRCRAGVSHVFRDIRELGEHIRTAALTADLMHKEADRICSFQDILLPYTLSLLWEQGGEKLIHPAIRILEEYDRAHEADLVWTLRVFLQENGSYTAAARALFIHRSTLIYRMERIAELTQTDLTDPDERFLLQMTLYMRERKDS
ncbi:MAG: helix-turn-helix domain-containing protein [Eubacterium sp.]|nr:helix-turn-helix domain-containing protein [Eubacterium sp.]